MEKEFLGSFLLKNLLAVSIIFYVCINKRACVRARSEKELFALVPQGRKTNKKNTIFLMG